MILVRRAINALVLHWRSEGDAASVRELLDDALLHLRASMEKRRWTAQEAALYAIKLFEVADRDTGFGAYAAPWGDVASDRGRHS